MSRSTGPRKAKPRADGRRAMLLYIKPALIRDLKKAAIDAGTTAFLVAEEAIKEWLDRNKDKPPVNR
jgi:hypothetical protein